MSLQDLVATARREIDRHDVFIVCGFVVLIIGVSKLSAAWAWIIAGCGLLAPGIVGAVRTPRRQPE